MSNAQATLMYREAAESAACVERQLLRNRERVRQLATNLRALPPSFVVTCARGSSDNAAMFAKHLVETELGIVTASAAPSVQSIYRTELKLTGALLLLISQSGRSPDLLQFAESARRAGARIVALLNTEDSPLNDLAHYALPLHAGPEKGVPATKSYICSLAAILSLIAEWKNDRRLQAAVDSLPDLLQRAWMLDWSRATEGLHDVKAMYVVGRGPGYAAALEIALKLKEVCGIHAEAISAAEVRHGPMALVEHDFPVLCLTQNDKSAAGVHEVASEFRQRGAKVLETAGAGADDLPAITSEYPPCTAIGMVQSFYRMANELALRRGRNPDRPPSLSKITKTL